MPQPHRCGAYGVYHGAPDRHEPHRLARLNSTTSSGPSSFGKLCLIDSNQMALYITSSCRPFFALGLTLVSILNEWDFRFGLSKSRVPCGEFELAKKFDKSQAFRGRSVA